MTELIITSSVLILVVIVLRHFLKGKISLRLQYALWALVLLRLLVPVALFESPFSVMNAVQAAKNAREVSVASAPTPTISSAYGDMGAENAAIQGGTEQNVTDPVTNVTHHVIRWGLLAQWVWYIGIGIVGLTLLISNLSFGRKLRKTREVYEADNCKLPVYTVDTLPSPCLFGLFRPSIYITPDVAGDDTRLCHVLAHELTHYHHGDHIWSALRGLCLAVHWYNPLVWLAAALSRRDSELACDEGTIKRIGEGSRMEYGRTLIGLTCEKRKAMDLLCCATTMTDGKKGIKERITLIAKKPKLFIPAVIAVVLVAAVTVGCTFTGAKNDAEIVPLSADELAQYNETFERLLYDEQGNLISVNPLSNFLTSYYDRPEDINLTEFLRYFSSDGDVADEAEFVALKAAENWPFGADATLDSMPVPIHKFSADTVNDALKKYTGITLKDLSGVGLDELIYLKEYDAYYNFTSDAGAASFTCTSGETQGDIVRLFGETATLTLKKQGDGFLIVSRQRTGDTSGESSDQAQDDITLLGPNGEKCPLKLGMRVDEATEKLVASNIVLKGDYTDQLFNEDYSLWFTEASDEAGQEKWVLSSISVKTPVIETAEGLKTGDADDNIEQIYGPCESVERDETEGHKYYYYEMENYILVISSGSGGKFSNPDDSYYVFSWRISSKEYSNIYFPREAEGEVSLPESSVLLASLPDDQIYLYGDQTDYDTTDAYDGLYLSINGVSRYYGWQNIGKESFLPALSLNDMDGDGQKELVIVLTTGEGTGVDQKAVHVIDPENFAEAGVTDPLNIISDNVDTSIVHENGSVTVTVIVNGQKSVITLPEDYAQGWAEDKASFGSIVTFEVDGSVLKATVPAQISNTVFAGEIVITYAFDGNQYVMKTIEYVPNMFLMNYKSIDATKS
jgi:beta-lactamase regulating signal transducer with metallopeptidase domain